MIRLEFSPRGPYFHAVNTDLIRAQIVSYRENGFIVIHDFLTVAELESWRDAVDEAVAELGNCKLAGHEGDKRWIAGDSYYARVFVQRINLWQANEKVRKLMLDPRLGKMAAQLAGGDEGRLVCLPQRADRTRCRAQHDTRLAARNDLSVHARRQHL